MPGAATKTVSYTTESMQPSDPNVPVLWHFTLLDSGSNPVMPEQTHTTPPPTVTFTGLSEGTFMVRGGQRNAAGGEVGTLVTSAPFTIVADITVSLVSAIA